MSARCEVCRGRQVITLPLYKPVEANWSADTPMAPEANVKEFPCPECSPRAKVEHVRFVEYHTLFDIDDRLPPEAMASQKRHAVTILAQGLLDHGYVEFRDDPLSRVELSRYEAMGRPTKRVLATVRVISKAAGQNLDGRVIEHGNRVAEKVAQEAKAEIDNWGSEYGHSDILKRDARYLIDSAARKIINAFAGRKEI